MTSDSSDFSTLIVKIRLAHCQHPDLAFCRSRAGENDKTPVLVLTFPGIGTHLQQSPAKPFSFIELSNRCDYDVSPSRMFDLPRLLPHRYSVGQRISALQ